MPDSTMRLSGALISSTPSERDVGKDSAIFSRPGPSGKAVTFSHALANANQRQSSLAHDSEVTRRKQMTRSERDRSAHSSSTDQNKSGAPMKMLSNRSQSDKSAGQRQSDVAANTPDSSTPGSKRLDRSGVSREVNKMTSGVVESTVNPVSVEEQSGVVELPSAVVENNQTPFEAVFPLGVESGSANLTPSGSNSGKAVTHEVLSAETTGEHLPIGESVLTTHAGSIGQQSTLGHAPEATDALPAGAVSESAPGLRGSVTVEAAHDESSLTETGPVAPQRRSASAVSPGSTDTITAKQADSSITTLPASLAARLVTGSDTATRSGTTGSADQIQAPIMNARMLSAADTRKELPGAGIIPTATNNKDALLVTHALAAKPGNSKGNTEIDPTIVKPTLPARGPMGLRLVVDDAMSTSTDPRSIEGSLTAATIKAAEGNTETALRFSQVGVPGANVTAGGAVMLPDNMLADVTGGIVTAPVSSRTDSVGTQIASAPLNVALLTPAANESLAGNIRWMVNEGVQNASVTVTPAGMGPIAVKIGIDNEQMNVSIVATQGSTREALDALLPRLREQLLSQGHDSVRVDVSDGKSDNTRSSGHQQQSNDRHAFASGQNVKDDGDSSEQRQEQYAGASSMETQLQHGERRLSDAELARVARLQGLLPDTARSLSALQHGYDLYV